jgi:hypothetical protein
VPGVVEPQRRPVGDRQIVPPVGALEEFDPPAVGPGPSQSLGDGPARLPPTLRDRHLGRAHRVDGGVSLGGVESDRLRVSGGDDDPQPAHQGREDDDGGDEYGQAGGLPVALHDRCGRCGDFYGSLSVAGLR